MNRQFQGSAQGPTRSSAVVPRSSLGGGGGMALRSQQQRGGQQLMGEPDPEDPHFVHEETKQLASQVKGVIQQHFQRHGTNEKQIVSSIKQFGVSEQSKVMMAKEKAAAELAIAQKIYGVWRNENARHEVNRDYCSRVGPLHKCFCGHDLATHGPVTVGKRGPVAPKCTACPCDEYRYIPNEPEEVGEHWLSRRPGFVPGAWVAKCRCGHGSADHDLSRRGGACNACRSCFKFDGHFLCNACDGKFHDHITLFETEDERRVAGRPIKGDFIPLKEMDWEVQNIVFGDGLGSQQITGGGHAIRGRAIASGGGDGGGGGGASSAMLGNRPLSSLSAARAQKTIQGGGPTAMPSHAVPTPTPMGGGGMGGGMGRPSSGAPRQRVPSMTNEALQQGGEKYDIASPHCTGCGARFRTATSKFCSSCGAKR